MFLNRVMRDIICDPHTMECELNSPYISFPLVQGCGATMEVTTRDFTDRIAKADIKDAEFLTRDSMGILQLHKLSDDQFRNLPVTLLAHFIYRFALNVGDSGLYNAITDSKLNFVYGIDITEKRGPLKDCNNLLSVMFTKLPRKELCQVIIGIAKDKKSELLNVLSKPLDQAAIENVAVEFSVGYDRSLFVQRIQIATALIDQL